MQVEQAPKNSFTLTNGTQLARNSFYNLLGYGIPLIVAIIIIPFLIDGLGEERFGIFNIALVVVGYFSFFDFGIGRALTKIIAEKIGLNQEQDISQVFWTSFLLMFIASTIGAIAFFFLSPTLIYDVFNITQPLQNESLITFYLLAFSIPVVTISAGLRGVLEAYQKFGMLNIIRTLLGVFTFIGPLLCLTFTTNLSWIIGLLVLIRIVIGALYLIECVKINNNLIKQNQLNLKLVIPVLKLSGWMTISNLIVPLIIYMDRLLIGTYISAAAVTYYSTPYEVVTKLLLVPGAITGVLFPAFSANRASNSEYFKKIISRALKYIFILLYPITFLIVVFASEVMGLWLGIKFAQNSSMILQLLAVGVLLNSLTFIPFTYLQGIGRANITAKIHLLEFPFYLFFMWISINQFGINGVAFVFLLRMIFDSLIFFLVLKKSLLININLSKNTLIFIALIILSYYPIFIENIILKVIFAVVIIGCFFFYIWRVFLVREEKEFLKLRLKTII